MIGAHRRFQRGRARANERLVRQLLHADKLAKLAAEPASAPRSGASAGVAAPLLDKGYGNVPRAADRPEWTRKQWQVRRAVIDRLRFWQAGGYQCLWVTLTSAPDSPDQRLRKDFQVLRKRVMRELGFDGFEYVCVDTREGHGVLHMVWAWKDPDSRKRASFYVPFIWLQDQWKGIHGAFHVNVKRIGGSDTDARRLSRYIVAQYCGGQDALVRLSQSVLAVSLTKMREALYRAVKGIPERYEQARMYKPRMFGTLHDVEKFGKLFGHIFWLEFRVAWDAMVRSRSCEAYGVQFVWCGGELHRV